MVRNQLIPLAILLVLISQGVSQSFWQPDKPPQPEQTQEPLQYAKEISRQISTQEWLGPLASIALSPFFGLACLSGLATYGPEWLQDRSMFFAPSSPMNNPILFWTMAGLTVLTSLPRFTKISKPIALLAENLESYSAIVILVVMKFASSSLSNTPAASPGEAMAEPVLQAGLVSYSTDVMLSMAAAVNLIVINTIKLGAEFVIWLMPIPFVDTAMEIFNKTACAALAALYAYSPLLASCFNLLLFALCATIFLQVTRYLRYFKYLYMYPVIRSTLGLRDNNARSISGFTKKRWRGIPGRSELTLNELSGNRFEITYHSLLSTKPLGIAGTKSITPGLLIDTLTLSLEGESIELDVRKGLASEESPAVAATT